VLIEFLFALTRKQKQRQLPSEYPGFQEENGKRAEAAANLKRRRQKL